ncbi:MAG TPA: hypothetical protein VLZ83_02290 [Edaphocola sp.]|nr:hypothetical protein [Edaphocola sp.]
MKKNDTFSIRIILVSIITFGIMMQSCEIADQSLFFDEKTGYSEYLDVNVHNNNKAFTERELKIINEAFMRIDKYLSEKSDIAFILNNKQEVGTSLNISQNLFEHLLLGINKGESIPIPPIRLKAGIETEHGPNYFIRSVQLSHSETIALMNAMQTVNSHSSQWGGVIASIVGTPAAGYLIGGKFYLEGLHWSHMEDNYLQGSQNGAEYIETTMISPTGMTHTSYQFIYH